MTNHQVTMNVHSAIDRGGSPIPGPGMIACQFLNADEIRKVAMGSRIRKLADWALTHFSGTA